MTRRGILFAMIGAGTAGLFSLLPRRSSESLLIDPEASRFAYEDGWIVPR